MINRITASPIYGSLLLLLLFGDIGYSQFDPYQLGRGIHAMSTDEGIFLSWRSYPQDAHNEISFQLLRNEKELLPSGQQLTNHLDPNGKISDSYQLLTYANGDLISTSSKLQPWAEEYQKIDLQTPKGYHINDGSIGDLDGDGQLELLIKMENRSHDNSHKGYTDPVLLHAYEMDGELMWSIDLGINIRAGAHYTQMMVADLDGDHIAEIICKTAPGTKDGLSNYLSRGPAAADDDTADYRNEHGYIISGPEYLTVFDGRTGRELSTTRYLPPRHPDTEYPSSAQLKELWGDGYGNRVDRFLAGVAYFDQLPSVVMCRGYYTRTTLAAWDYRDGELTQRWFFDTQDHEDLRSYSGQGAHSLSVGDVDGDGLDEIMYGAMAIDHDGQPLYSTHYDHGDATHLADIIPEREGLEFFMPHESAGRVHDGITNPALSVRDARTGQVLWTKHQIGDIGRGLSADITDEYPGMEVWASAGLGVYSSLGEKISDLIPSINFAIWWDGDLQRELLDKNQITKWHPTHLDTLLLAPDAQSNNGTKSTPVLSGDIMGDWREEVIWRSLDDQSLYIYSTPIPTDYSVPSLLFDRNYRLALIWQNVAYNQPPHPSYDIQSKAIKY